MTSQHDPADIREATRASAEYKAGVEAFDAGGRGNPFPPFTNEHAFWDEGWHDAVDAHDRRRSRALGGSSSRHDPHQQHRTFGIKGIDL